MGCIRCRRENFTLWVVSCSYSEAHGIRTPLYLILRWTAARGLRARRGCAQLGGGARLRSTLSLAGEDACATHCLFFQFRRFWQPGSPASPGSPARAVFACWGGSPILACWSGISAILAMQTP